MNVNVNVKRNHTPQRRRMTEKRLFDLCILSFEKEYTKEIRKKPEIIIRMLKGNVKFAYLLDCLL